MPGVYCERFCLQFKIFFSGVVALSNGCVCCSKVDHLQNILWNILQDDYSSFHKTFSDIDYVVIETSGVTDPLGLIELLERKYGKMTRIRLDSLVTVIDSDVLLSLVENQGNIPNVFISQVKCADVILLNKQDLVSNEQ